MKEQMNNIIVMETKALEVLLSALDEQYKYLVNNDVFALEKITLKIENCSREIAKYEMERRSLTNGASMREIINQLNDEELEENYRNIQKVIESVRLQKESNEMIIKQGLGFTTKMLSVLNPDKSPKTYNAYGKR